MSSAQSNPYVKVAYFGVACSATLHKLCMEHYRLNHFFPTKNAYYVLGSVLGVGDTSINNTINLPPSLELTFWLGNIGSKEIHE